MQLIQIFGERVINNHHIELILLAMPNGPANIYALDQLKSRHFQGQIAAIAKYSDDETQLHQQGIDAAFNIIMKLVAASHETCVITYNLKYPPLKTD